MITLSPIFTGPIIFAPAPITTLSPITAASLPKPFSPMVTCWYIVTFFPTLTEGWINIPTNPCGKLGIVLNSTPDPNVPPIDDPFLYSRFVKLS